MGQHRYAIRKEKPEVYALDQRGDAAAAKPFAHAQAGPETGFGGGREATASVAATARKTKYSINSYLLNVVSKFPRRYAYHFLGKEKFRKYCTMPFRLSMSRFLANKLAKSYYTGISAKAFLREKLAKSPMATRGLQSAPGGGKGFWDDQVLNENKNEKAKNFSSRSEQRLDIPLLRLLNPKPTYIRKRMSPKQRWLHQLDSASRTHPKPRSTRYRLDPPIPKYTSLQTKQLINHGFVYVNDKKVTTASCRPKVGDQIKITGFAGGTPSGTLPGPFGPVRGARCAPRALALGGTGTTLTARFGQSELLAPEACAVPSTTLVPMGPREPRGDGFAVPAASPSGSPSASREPGGCAQRAQEPVPNTIN
jgi:hypothetical protein